MLKTYVAINKNILGNQNTLNTSSQLSRYFNHKLYDSKRVIDRFVGDNQNIPIIDKCSVKDCYKIIKNCTGLICQCCDIITCKPNFSATRTLINGKSTMHISNEDKNIVRISRVSILCFSILQFFEYLLYQNQILGAIS